MCKILVFSVILSGFFIIRARQTETCNVAVCGSIVSKCLLIESCKCDLKRWTCYKNCFNCLNHLYNECCSCLDICRIPEKMKKILLNQKSRVENCTQPMHGLFGVLTAYPDPHKRWSSITYPVVKATCPKKHQIKVHMQSAKQKVTNIKNTECTTNNLNCTVAFLTQCLNWTSCKINCQTMGASSCRWFQDGCCECIGQHCINYGINESRCRKCSVRTKKFKDNNYN